MQSVRSVMRAVLLAIAAFGDAAAWAAPEGGAFLGFGASSDGAGGTDYVRFSPVQRVASLEHGLLAGVFGEGDFRKQYAIDATGALVRINTHFGTVTTIGPLGIPLGPHVLLAIDPISSLVFMGTNDAACQTTTFYTVDRVTGAATPSLTLPPCYQSMVFDSNGNLFLLDRDTEAIAIFSGGSPHELGPLGIPVEDSAVLALDPANDSLYLVQFYEGDNRIWFVNATTGSAFPIGQTLGGAGPVAALAFVTFSEEDIFFNGFD